MIEALAEPITSILDSVVGVVERTPPALVGDILEQGGITMTGAGRQERHPHAPDRSARNGTP